MKKIAILPVLENIRKESHFSNALIKNGINTVYHAAVYKHVHLVEANVFEGIKNNLFGTLLCVKAAISHKVDTFVLISTDKAVRPTSVMGASKRLAEMALQALQASPLNHLEHGKV